MKKEAIPKEWEKLTFEITQNTPNIDFAYPSSVVRIRELLLIGQVELEKIEAGDNFEFHAKIYQTIMKYYFKQKNG